MGREERKGKRRKRGKRGKRRGRGGEEGEEERRRGGEEEGRRVVVDALRNERPIRRSPRVEGTRPPCGRHVDATWFPREFHATCQSAERLGWALVYLNPISRPISRIGRPSRILPTPQPLTSCLFSFSLTLSSPSPQTCVVYCTRLPFPLPSPSLIIPRPQTPVVYCTGLCVLALMVCSTSHMVRSTGRPIVCRPLYRVRPLAVWAGECQGK